MYVFSVEEPDGIRTYIWDKDEDYVSVLEPLRNKDEYYLLTAYHIEGKDKAGQEMETTINRFEIKAKDAEHQRLASFDFLFSTEK